MATNTAKAAVAKSLINNNLSKIPNASPLGKLRIASTLIIVTKNLHNKDNNQNVNVPYQDFKVLLIQRSARMSFMANLFAFPGGGLDEHDKWSSSEMNEATDTDYDPVINPVKEENKIYRITALRELFEETGILLASKKAKNQTNIQYQTQTQIHNHNQIQPSTKPNLNFEKKEVDGDNVDCPVKVKSHKHFFSRPFDYSKDKDTDSSDSPFTQQINQIQLKIHKEPNFFLPFLKQNNLKLNTNAIHPWARWVTPLAEKKRFDTWFYITALDNEPIVQCEPGEISSFKWLSPCEALEMAKLAKIGLPPPTTYVLNELSKFNTLDSLFGYLARKDSRPCDLIMPCLYFNKEKSTIVTVLPGDSLYQKLNIQTGEELEPEPQLQSAPASGPDSLQLQPAGQGLRQRLHRVVQIQGGYWLVEDNYTNSLTSSL